MNNNCKNKSSYTRDNDTPASNSTEFIKLLKNSGMIEDESIVNSKRRLAKQMLQKAAYHNTLLLLKNYRNIAWITECMPETIACELNERFTDLDKLIDKMDVQMSLDNKKLEFRLAGAKKTKLLLDRINEALTVLRKKPGNGMDLYNVISETFIVPEINDIRTIAYNLNISVKTYYKLRDQAIAIISIRLWSAPTLETDIWLEIMSLLWQF